MEEFLKATIMEFIVFLVSIKSLMFPPLPVMHCTAASFDKIIFKRSLFKMLCQTNAQFAVHLCNALYNAEHAHTHALEALLLDGEDLQNVMSACAPHSEVKDSNSSTAAATPTDRWCSFTFRLWKKPETDISEDPSRVV